MGFFKNLFGSKPNKSPEAISPNDPTPAPLAPAQTSEPASNKSLTPENTSGDTSLTETKPPISSPSADLAAVSKPAWLWVMTDGEGAADSTRTGGRPIMGEDEPWPTCGDCKNPLTFHMQSNLDALPDGMKPPECGGILRFFYCLQDDCVGMGGWDAFDPQHHISILHGYGHTRETPKGTIEVPPKMVSRYENVDDVPHWDDRDDLKLPDDDDAFHPAEDHKYGGWPLWIQGAERPNCPTCSAVMQPFIQLDEASEHNFNFGGGGIGHISQCSDHPDQLAFGWACG